MFVQSHLTAQQFITAVFSFLLLVRLSTPSREREREREINFHRTQTESQLSDSSDSADPFAHWLHSGAAPNCSTTAQRKWSV